MTLTVRTVVENSTNISVAVNLHEDARLEFPCSARSDDLTPVTVRWYRVNEHGDDESRVYPIPDQLTLSDNGSLIIRLSENDTTDWGTFRGAYRCHASNSYSEAERNVFIHVIGYVSPGQ